MTTLTIDLPDNLAKEAREAGLLDPEAIETLLRKAVRQKAVDELFDAMDRMAAVDEPAIMSPEEIQNEIDAYRRDVRRAAGS